MAGDDTQDSGQWLRIADFSPGIHEDFYPSTGGASTLPRNGAATKTNTYRVHADPLSGALAPLPRAVAGGTDTPPGTLSSGWYPPNNMAMYVGDAMVQGVVRARNANNDTTPEAVYVGWTFTYDNDGGANGYRRYALLREYQLYSGGSRADLLFSKDTTNVTPPVGGYAMGLEAGMYSTTPILHAMHDYLVGTPAAGAMSAADLALTTYDTDAATAYYFTGFVSGHRGGSIVTVGGGSLGYSFLVGHQGRIVRFQARMPSSGFYGATNYRTADFISYSNVRDYTVNTEVLFMEENQTGTGAAASLTADQLLIVKNYGGAYMIRGSLANPTIVRLPFVQSTEGVLTRAALTPIGAVYGTRSGIYAYAGGDTAQNLSPQLSGEFWRIAYDQTNEFSFGIESRFDWWAPFVCVGNNYIFDARTKGWWRLDDPSSYSNRAFSHYSASPTTGTLYAFPYKLTAANQPVWYRFGRDVLAQSWSWQSQPLVETTQDMWEFQEVELVAMRPANASATCTVTVTLTGLDHTGATVATRDMVFDLSTCAADKPAILRRRVRSTAGDGVFTARYVQVRIEASSSSGHAAKVFPGVGMWARRARQTPRA